jgi:ribonuclease HI
VELAAAHFGVKKDEVVELTPDVAPSSVQKKRARSTKKKVHRVIEHFFPRPLHLGDARADVHVVVAFDGGCHNQGTEDAISGTGLSIRVMEDTGMTELFKDTFGVRCNVPHTSNRAELWGSICAMHWALMFKSLHENATCRMTLLTDSKYTMDCILGTGGTANRDLIDEAHVLFSQCRRVYATVTVEKVKGHSGHVLNDEADVAATCAIHSARRTS